LAPEVGHVRILRESSRRRTFFSGQGSIFAKRAIYATNNASRDFRSIAVAVKEIADALCALLPYGQKLDHLEAAVLKDLGKMGIAAAGIIMLLALLVWGSVTSAEAD